MSSLAVREIPDQLLALTDEKAGLPEQVIREAFTTIYAPAAQHPGDIARALVRCKRLGLDPLLGHIQLIPQTRGRGQDKQIIGFSPFTTLMGRVQIARKHDPTFVIEWDAPEIRDGIGDYPDRNTGQPQIVKKVFVTCHVSRGGRRVVSKVGSCEIKPHGEEIASSRAARNALKFAFPEIGWDLEPDVDETLDGQIVQDAIDVTPTDTQPAPTQPAPTQPGTSTAKQRQILAILAQQMGLNANQRREKAGVESFKDLSYTDAEQLIDAWRDHVESEPAAAGADPATSPPPAAATSNDDMLDEAVANVEDILGGEQIPPPALGHDEAAEPVRACSPDRPAPVITPKVLVEQILQDARRVYPVQADRASWLRKMADKHTFDHTGWQKASVEVLQLLVADLEARPTNEPEAPI